MRAVRGVTDHWKGKVVIGKLANILMQDPGCLQDDCTYCDPHFWVRGVNVTPNGARRVPGYLDHGDEEKLVDKCSGSTETVRLAVENRRSEIGYRIFITPWLRLDP